VRGFNQLDGLLIALDGGQRDCELDAELDPRSVVG
jgi:hypothetical protein